MFTIRYMTFGDWYTCEDSYDTELEAQHYAKYLRTFGYVDKVLVVH